MTMELPEWCAGDPNSVSNPDAFLVKHIELDWTVNFAQELINGHVILHIESLLPSSDELVLDASALDITRVTDNLSGTDLVFGTSAAMFGGKLTIRVRPGESHRVKIEYSTTKAGQALQWLRPEQTSGGVYPYVFSQCQAILARSLLPCQDTPSVKATYEARVRVEDPLTVVMSADYREEIGDQVLLFKQNMPVPAYLIAIAAGKLESRPLSERSRVWAESELLEAAAWEFAQLPECLAAAEELCGPYRWGRYDILILPPSFPFGGMENPCLTFLTPSLLAGDRSMVNVIAHEMAHSWTGNLVTNRSWEHFWLNEGFTTFLERKIIGRLEGEPARQLHAFVGLGELQHDLETFPEDHEARRLSPSLTGLDPDEAFSVVPYEKGHTLLFHLEQLVGGPAPFEAYLRDYIQTFSDAAPLDTKQWLDHLVRYFPDHPIRDIPWMTWLKGTGMPPVIPEYDRSLMTAVKQFAQLWLRTGGDLKSDVDDPFARHFNAWQQMLFLDQIMEEEGPVQVGLLAALDSRYNLSSSKNVELLLRWYKMCLGAAYSPSYTGAARFATMHGRMKYCRPIYRALYANEETRQLAVETFREHQGFYHPKAAAMIAKDLHLA